MTPIKYSMTTINYKFEYYQNNFIIYDFMSGEEIIKLEDIEFMDLLEFIEHIVKNR